MHKECRILTQEKAACATCPFGEGACLMIMIWELPDACWLNISFIYYIVLYGRNCQAATLALWRENY